MHFRRLCKPWFLLIFTLWFLNIFSLWNHILIITANFWWILRFFDKFMRPIEKIKMDLTDVISRLAPGSKLESNIFRNLLLVSKISFHHMIISFTRYTELNFSEQCRILRNNLLWNAQIHAQINLSNSKNDPLLSFLRKSTFFTIKIIILKENRKPQFFCVNRNGFLSGHNW